MQGYPNPIIARPPMFGRDPVQTTCSNCRQQIVTSVESENGACTWIAVILTLLLCCPFFWVPLVVDSCKDYRHVCPACHALLGTFKKV